MNLWPVENFFIILVIPFWLGLLLHPANPPKSDDKYVEKSVQLVRGSSFRNELLQNPYFRTCMSFRHSLDDSNLNCSSLICDSYSLTKLSRGSILPSWFSMMTFDAFRSKLNISSTLHSEPHSFLCNSSWILAWDKGYYIGGQNTLLIFFFNWGMEKDPPNYTPGVDFLYHDLL